MTIAETIRTARQRSGLTQAELARRAGVSQPVIARLESPGTNPTVRTLERALRATGHRLVLRAEPDEPQVDEGQIRSMLQLSPAERLHSHGVSHRNLRAFVREARPVG